MKTYFLIRCRETGLFYHPGAAGSMGNSWVCQEAARRFDKKNAEWYVEHLKSLKYCVHIVPAGWTPAAEKDPLKVRVLSQLQALYHFFKH